MLLVTGAAGFIGSNFVIRHLQEHDEPVVVLDALTYAGDLGNLADVKDDPRLVFVHGDVADSLLVDELFERHRPRAVVHFAAESHVDRSISDPLRFVQTNVMGTANLLSVCQRRLGRLPADFRFINISTDEVYGSLPTDIPPSDETRAFAPSSPYSASKAAADQLGHAFFKTYGLPVVTVRCTNNYGPRQYPEKLLPFMISRAIKEKPLTIYGDGEQIRDWIHVDDFCRAIETVLKKGVPGESYNIGANHEMTNLDFLRKLCATLDRLRPRNNGKYENLIAHVADRPGHDRRYGLDAGKIRRELGWRPQVHFDEGFEETVRWYLQRLG